MSRPPQTITSAAGGAHRPSPDGVGRPRSATGLAFARAGFHRATAMSQQQIA